MVNNDLAVVDHQDGRIGPRPEWVRVALAAKWWGATPWALMRQPDWQFWTEAGLLMKSLEAEAHENARKKTP